MRINAATQHTFGETVEPPERRGARAVVAVRELHNVNLRVFPLEPERPVSRYFADLYQFGQRLKYCTVLMWTNTPRT